MLRVLQDDQGVMGGVLGGKPFNDHFNNPSVSFQRLLDLVAQPPDYSIAGSTAGSHCRPV